VSSWAQSRPCSIHVLMLRHHHLISVMPRVLRDPIHIGQYTYLSMIKRTPAVPHADCPRRHSQGRESYEESCGTSAQDPNPGRHVFLFSQTIWFRCCTRGGFDVRDAVTDMGIRQMEDAWWNSGGEVVGRKFAEVSRSTCIAIGGREWQVGRFARATQNFEPAELLEPQLHTFSTTPPHHRQLS
jgi:hypothetical protein